MQKRSETVEQVARWERESALRQVEEVAGSPPGGCSAARRTLNGLLFKEPQQKKRDPNKNSEEEDEEGLEVGLMEAWAGDLEGAWRAAERTRKGAKDLRTAAIAAYAEGQYARLASLTLMAVHPMRATTVRDSRVARHAIEALSLARRQAPDTLDAPATLSLARALRDSGDYHGASREFGRFLKMPGPRRHAVALEAVETIELGGDAERASREYDVLARRFFQARDAKHAYKAMFAGARCKSRLGRVRDATVLFERCVELKPNSVGARMALGAALLREKHTLLALDQFLAVVSLDANCAPAYYYASRALLLEAADRLDVGDAPGGLLRVGAAVDAVSLCLAVDPRNHQALALKASLPKWLHNTCFPLTHCQPFAETKRDSPSSSSKFYSHQQPHVAAVAPDLCPEAAPDDDVDCLAVLDDLFETSTATPLFAARDDDFFFDPAAKRDDGLVFAAPPPATTTCCAGY